MTAVTKTRVAPNTWDVVAGKRSYTVRKYRVDGEVTFEVWRNLNPMSKYFAASEHVEDAFTLADAVKAIRNDSTN